VNLYLANRRDREF